MTDPTRGLVYSQGTLLQHLIFAIVAVYIGYVIEPAFHASEGDIVWEWNVEADPNFFTLEDNEVIGKAVLKCLSPDVNSE